MYKFNKAILITFLLVSVLILTSCSGSQNSISEDGAAYPAEGGIASPPMMTPSPDVGMDSGYVREDSKYNEYQDEQESGEKIITTISISIESTDFEASINKLKELIDLNNGYLSNSNISNNSYYYQDSFRSGNFTVRIPKEKLNEFLTKIDEIGNITAENLSSDDVSSYYFDTESRLSVLATKKERLLTLLDKAEKIEDIITLETELGNVIYEMESLKSILINLDDKVDYSTVHISVQEVQKTTNIETVKTPFGEKIKNAIQDSFYNFKIKIENLILYMASNILMLIVYVFTFILGWNFAKKNVKFDRIRKMKKDKNVESK